MIPNEGAQSHGEWLDALLAHSHRRAYAANDTIIRGGADSTVLYYVLSGSVRVIHEDEEGRELVLAYLNEGEFFGEMGLFDRLARRSACVTARTDCVLAEAGYDQIRHIAGQAPDILFAITAQLARRLRHTSTKVHDLAFLDVTGRIARALLELAQQPDALTHPDGMQIKITRQELGRIVSCSREMAGRVLAELERDGHIRIHGTKTVVVHGAR